MSRLVAYLAYATGSCVFLVVAVSRGSWWVSVGSALFLLGTLLLLREAVGRPRAERLDRSGAHRSR